MGWFDDLSTRAQQAGDSALKDVNTYLAGRVVDATVQVAAAQTGNLTAAQLAAGQRGGQGPMAGPATTSPFLQNASQASQIAGQAAMNYGPYLLVAIAAWFLIGKSRRG